MKLTLVLLIVAVLFAAICLNEVIQPTPEMTPSGSEQTLYEEPGKLNASRVHGLKVPPVHDRMHRLTVDRSEIGLAPLASISSLGSFSSQTSPWLSSLRRRDHKEEIHEDSVGSDSVFADEIDTEDEVEEFETDSELEDGFDDDYSFCESSARCERPPRIASFDSCDMSVCEVPEEKQKSPRDLRRQMSVQDGTRVRKRLIKTYSEPRHSKQLPVWIEKGRSGYVPRRQLSAPVRPKEVVPERPQIPLPCSGSSSDSVTLTHHDLSQGTQVDMPSSEKRARFTKQRTIQEGLGGGLGGLLAPPAVTLSRSCERLAEMVDDQIVIVVPDNVPSIQCDSHPGARQSSTSSQETLQ